MKLAAIFRNIHGRLLNVNIKRHIASMDKRSAYAQRLLAEEIIKEARDLGLYICDSGG